MAAQALTAWLPSVASMVEAAASTTQMVGACLIWLRYMRLILPGLPGPEADLDDRLFHIMLVLLGFVGSAGVVTWAPWWLSTLVVFYTSIL